MKRRNSIQIITPKMPKPATRWPLTRSADMPNISTPLTISASSTGPPTTSAMKMVRRDHSISPSERSNTRRAAPKYDMRGPDPNLRPDWPVGLLACRRHCFTRYLKTACRLSSGDCTSSICPASPDAASSVSRA